MEMQQKRTGVLLIQLGTPDSPSTGDVRSYLRQFLSDPRVIDIPFLIRMFLVHLLLLPFVLQNLPRFIKSYGSMATMLLL